MEKIHVINSIVKMTFSIFFVYLVYTKISNYRENNRYKIIFMFIWSFNISIIYRLLISFVTPIFSLVILVLLFASILKFFVIKNLFNYITYIISFVIAYIMYLVSILISGIILRLCVPSISSKNSISLITIPVVESLLFYLIFKINRFKYGFNFINSTKFKENLIKYIIIFSGISMILFGLLQKKNNIVINTFVFMGILLVSTTLVIWIKSQITKTYKSRMRDRTIEMQKTEIDEQARIMDELKTENLKLASAIHKYNKKFSALEFAMKNAVESGANTEFANEISVILEETKDASKNFAKETEININKLPLTNNVGIDNMFKYMQEEARKKDISFDLKLNTSINPLLENIISKDKFETLIGDHLKDAIIAVDARGDSYKSILSTLGVVEGIYEFSVYDTGIEFEIDTLLKLGKEQITTHKEEGGNGIGFMTTFETLKECKASLIIEEYNPETTNYTKAVVIRFDGKNQYKIYSYRAEEIKKQNKGRRISIKQLR